MLLAEGHTVAHAAADARWTSTSAFIEAFAQITGITPGRYAAGLGRHPGRISRV